MATRREGSAYRVSAGSRARRLLAKLDRLIERVLFYTSGLLLISIACMVFYAVFMRYLFSASPLWSEAAPRVFFLWMTYFGIAVATKRGQNIRVTFVIERLPPKVRLYFELFMHALVAVMIAIIFWYSIPIIRLNSTSTMLATGWSNAVTYIPLPVGSLLMILYTTTLVRRSFATYRGTPASEA